MPDNHDDLAERILDLLARRLAASSGFAIGIPPEAQSASRSARGAKRKDDPDRPRYVDEHEAARQLDRKVQTLRGARCGRGPLAKVLPYHRVAGRIICTRRRTSIA